MKKILFIIILCLINISVYAETEGVIRYVRADGSNRVGWGTTPDSPYATLTYALADASLTDEARDTIYLMYSATPHNEYFLINKKRLSVVGYGNLKPIITRKSISYYTTAGFIFENNVNNAGDSLYISNIQFGEDDFQEMAWCVRFPFDIYNLKSL